MAEIHFGEFRQVVIRQIREIEAERPEYQSTEWYLLRYLRRIERTTLPPASPGRVENSVRALVRFYVDSIEEKSVLGERCRQVSAEYRKVTRST